MKTPPGSWRLAATLASFLAIFLAIPSATGLDGLLLQDAYVDNGTPFQTFLNYGNSGDLRVFKNGTRSIRSLLKFSLGTLPPGATAANVTQARLRLWVNTYAALQANTNVQPPGPRIWDLVAQKGDAGTIGAQGPIGPAGQNGAPGPAGPRGETGF